MRDKNRIPRMIRLIKVIWQMNPDLRLFQLLENVFPCREGHYYVEDDVLEKELKRLYLPKKITVDKRKKL